MHVAAVRKPLLAVADLTASGHDVVFQARRGSVVGQAFARHVNSGRRYDFEQKNGVYELPVRVMPPTVPREPVRPEEATGWAARDGLAFEDVEANELAGEGGDLCPVVDVDLDPTAPPPGLSLDGWPGSSIGPEPAEHLDDHVEEMG